MSGRSDLVQGSVVPDTSALRDARFRNLEVLRTKKPVLTVVRKE